MLLPCRIFAFCLLLIQQGVCAEDVVRVDTDDELSRALRQAKPGSVISIAPGNYRGGLFAAGLRGTKDGPIVIAGTDPANPPVIAGDGGVQLSSPEHVELRDLIIAKSTGNGLNIDDAGSSDTPARNVVLRNLIVRDVGPDGNRDAIKLSGVNGFHIEYCHIERWGSGGSAIDMVGCRQGVIKNCKFSEARGDGANGVQAKGGSRQIMIQRCRFENAGGRAVNIGGSTGLAFFRPRPEGFEAKEITVEDCEFIGGASAIAFVGVDGSVVRHNTIYAPGRWAVRILQETTDPGFVSCRKGSFVRNIVVFRSAEIRELINIGDKTAPETFEFTGNLWYCSDRPADTKRLVRLPVPEMNGGYGIDPGFKHPASGDLTIPKRGPHDPGVRSAVRTQ